VAWGETVIIRAEQVALMEEVALKRYHEQLRKLLRERFPQLVSRLDDPMLLQRIALGVRQARGLGVRTGEGILAYVGLSIAAGPAFNTDPKIRYFFELPGRDPDSKVRWLFKRVVQTLQFALEPSRGI